LRILAKAASFLANFVAASCFCFFCQQTKESPRQRQPTAAKPTAAKNIKELLTAYYLPTAPTFNKFTQ
jgi:hypothetical protein